MGQPNNHSIAAPKLNVVVGVNKGLGLFNCLNVIIAYERFEPDEMTVRSDGGYCLWARRAAVATMLLLSLSLGGCATATGGSSLMDARAEVSAPSKTSAYPLVEDLPPDRENPVMTPDGRSKLQKDLTAARDRQRASGKIHSGAPAEPAKP